jgi:hypothetical protein
MRQLKRNRAQKESGKQGIEEGKTTGMQQIYGNSPLFLKSFHDFLPNTAVAQMVIVILVIIRCIIQPQQV